MQYSLKCDPRTARDNFPCGEWDYLTYNDIHIHTGEYDSTQTYTPLYSMKSQSPDTIFYTTTPMKNTYHYNKWHMRNIEQSDVEEFVYGDGSEKILTKSSARMQFMLSRNELSSSGISKNIGMMKLKFSKADIELKNFKVKLAAVASTLEQTIIEDDFMTVYYDDITTQEGWTEIYFPTSFKWQSLFNIIVDISYESELDGEELLECSAGTTIESVGKDNFLFFEGINERVECSAPELAGTDQFTFETWVRIDNWNKWTNIFNNDGKFGLQLGNDEGQIYGLMRDNNNTWGRTGQVVDVGDWFHIAMVYEGSGKYPETRLKIFINGQEKPLFFRGIIPQLSWDKSDIFLLGGPGFSGGLSEIRVWDKALSREVIQHWYQKVYAESHPDSDNLLLYFPVLENDVETLSDLSGNERNSRMIGLPVVKTLKPDNYNKNTTIHNKRPLISLANGQFQNEDSISEYTEEVDTPMHTLIEWEINDYQPTIKSIQNVYPGGWEYTFSPDGEKIDSSYVEPTEYVVNDSLEYYTEPQEITDRIEIGRFITPYGINLDLGPDGFMWQYDVTDYAPYLTGYVDLSCGNLQELLDVKFLFIKGTPPREVKEITRIWGPRRSYKYKDLDNDNQLSAKTIALDPEATQFKVITRLTGHGHRSNDGSYPHCCEWKFNTHYLSVEGDGGSNNFDWKIMTSDCGTNPVYPQGGTWPYEREGWCPGDVVDDFSFELGDIVGQGDSLTFDYSITPVPDDNKGMGEGNYVVAMHLIQYGDQTYDTDAEITRILNPNDEDIMSRFNPTCSYPQIYVRNNGKNDVEEIDFEYYVSGGEPEIYTWNGSIKPNKEELIGLPISSGLFWLGDDNNIFTCKISAVNKSSDDYPNNDIVSTTFTPPDLYEENIEIYYKTNNRPQDYTLLIVDQFGEVVLSEQYSKPNNLYKIPLNLAKGCYFLELQDQNSSGLSFWAQPNQGSGYFQIHSSDGTLLKDFDPDFGAGLYYSFTMYNITKVHESGIWRRLRVSPSPANSEINISVNMDLGKSQVDIIDINGQIVKSFNDNIQHGYTKKINISELPAGSYFIKITNSDMNLKSRFIKK